MVKQPAVESNVFNVHDIFWYQYFGYLNMYKKSIAYGYDIAVGDDQIISRFFLCASGIFQK